MRITISTDNHSSRQYRPRKGKSNGFFLPILFLCIGLFGMLATYQANENAIHYEGVVQSVEYRPNYSYSASVREKCMKYEILATVYIEEINDTIYMNAFSSNTHQFPKKGEPIQLAKTDVDYVWEQSPSIEFVIPSLFTFLGLYILVKEIRLLYQRKNISSVLNEEL